MFRAKREKNKQKESNRATTPENHKTFEKLTLIKVMFFIWNIFSIALYSAYTLLVIYKLSEKSFLSKVIIYLLYAYAIIFVLLILINIGNRKRMKYQLKNYKSATNFLKYAIQILNFSLSIFTAISAFITTGKTDFSAIAFAVLSMIITALLIFFEIIKIIIRKNIPIIKRNFLELRDKPEKQKKDNND